MRRLLVGCGVLVLATAIGLVAFLLSSTGRALRDAVGAFTSSEEPGVRLETDEDVLAYLRAHPDRYAIAAWEVGNEDGGVFHEADVPLPLASTVKIVPLLLAAQRLATGEWDAGAPFPAAEVERFWLPGTDGDAHEHALAEADGGVVDLAFILRAMIRHSDNAATDAIVFRLGRSALDDGAEKLGVARLHPLSGAMLLAMERYDAGARERLDDDAWARATQLSTDAEQSARRLRDEGSGLVIAEQEAMARTLDNRGTARSFARLMERVVTGEVAGAADARAYLAWPMAFEANQRDFVTLGTKGGSLPGVLTSASFAETKSGHRRVLALFIHDLPFASWAELARSFAHQKLERAVLLDDDGLEWLRAGLR